MAKVVIYYLIVSILIVLLCVSLSYPLNLILFYHLLQSLHFIFRRHVRILYDPGHSMIASSRWSTHYYISYNLLSKSPASSLSALGGFILS